MTQMTKLTKENLEGILQVAESVVTDSKSESVRIFYMAISSMARELIAVREKEEEGNG